MITNQAIYKAIVNTAQTPIFITTSDGRILEANLAACKLFGFSLQEFTQINRREIIDHSATVIGNTTGHKKNGETFPLEFSCMSFTDETGEELNYTTVNDTSDRKKAEREMALLIDNTDESFVLLDKELQIVSFNNQLYKLYKNYFGREIKKGCSILEYAQQERKEIVKDIYQKVLAGSYEESEIAIPLPDGTEKLFTLKFHPAKDENNNIIGVFVSAADMTEKIKSENLLKHSRQQLDALINTTNDLIWSVSKDFTLIAANRAFIEDMKVYTGKDLRPGDDLIKKSAYPQLVLDTWTVMYIRTLSGESFTSEIYTPPFRHFRERWAEVTFNPIINKNEITGIACYSRNITEKKSFEKELLRTNERLESAQQIAKLGYWEYNLQTDELFWSKEVYKIFGIPRTETGIKFETFINRIHPDDRHFFQEQKKKALREKHLLSVEHRIVLDDQSVKYVIEKGTLIVNEEGLPVIFEGTVQDITDRKIIEESLRLSNERYNLVAKATNDAIWDWNVERGEVIRTGTGLENLFGYESEQASGNNNFWTEKVHPEDLHNVIQKRLHLFNNTKEVYWEDEYRFLKANGNYAYVYDKGYIIRNENGSVKRMIGATQDITERKETEILLKELNEKLELRATELEMSNAELEKFAYVASHDLQEPLRMVSSFLQLLEKKYKGQLDANADQYIHFAVDGAKRMKTLILDLLEYSRIGRSKDIAGDTNMNEVIQEVLATFRNKIEKLNATVHVSELPVLSKTRRTQMVQLMQNLVGNALKYHSDRQPEITIDVKKEERQWIFSVIDNGIGFDQKFVDKVFVIFQRLHNTNEYTGTGIGLSICKKIVELHGGRIWVESTSGEGSSFYFSLTNHNF